MGDFNILANNSGITPSEGLCLTYLRSGSETEFSQLPPCVRLPNNQVSLLPADMFWRDSGSNTYLEVELKGEDVVDGSCQWTADNNADCNSTYGICPATPTPTATLTSTPSPTPTWTPEPSCVRLQLIPDASYTQIPANTYTLIQPDNVC